LSGIRSVAQRGVLPEAKAGREEKTVAFRKEYTVDGIKIVEFF